jgi:hypothetical protein
MGLLLAACETLEPRQLLLPMNLINRLVLTGQQAFSTQYIQVCFMFICKYLSAGAVSCGFGCSAIHLGLTSRAAHANVA